MSFSSGSNVEHSGHSSCFFGSDREQKAQWSGVNIAIMVFSFVFFWPAGLVVLYWIMTGRNAVELPAALKEKMSGLWRQSGARESQSNRVFDEYQQTQYDRIREIKDEIKERSRRFEAFRRTAKRRADQEEFNQFMASTPTSAYTDDSSSNVNT